MLFKLSFIIFWFSSVCPPIIDITSSKVISSRLILSDIFSSSSDFVSSSDFISSFNCISFSDLNNKISKIVINNEILQQMK